MSSVSANQSGSSLGSANVSQEGGRRKGVTVKALKKTLKKAGLKTTGKKATLRARAKKAHLKMKGGVGMEGEETAVAKALDAPAVFEEESRDGGRRRRSRKSRGFRLF